MLVPMDEAALRHLLDDVRTGAVTADDAVARLRRLPYADLGFARVDHHRSLRQGMAEAVYGPGKTPEQCAAIVAELLDTPGARPAAGPGPGPDDPTARRPTDGRDPAGPTDRGGVAGPPVLLTRADEAQVAAAMAQNPGGERTGSTVVWRPAPLRAETVVLATAGTADLPVADECAATLAAHGIKAVRLTDVGVAGVHRLLASADQLATADAVVVVAGMEGALASIVGGITPAPVVAVPTSAGYGASLEGVTALLGMLASCAAGVTVVGIDNGFGAASAVLRILL
jgi:pyridinium-3,5-biscarboxylic acid mononucleotide synthase